MRASETGGIDTLVDHAEARAAIFEGGVGDPRRLNLPPIRGRRFSDEQKYSPYAIDWRFLPEEALMVKDYIRHHVVAANDLAAQNTALRPLWVNTIGRRTSAAIKAARVLFIHIPKTGGTSISQRLYGRNLPHFSAPFYARVFPQSVSGLPSFTVIRHPIERIISGYKMASSGGTDLIAYSRYQRSRLRGLDTLESFVDYLFENRNQLSKLPGTLHDQASLILDHNGHVMVDRMFSLDRRRGLPSELGRWLGIDSVPHLNTSKPQNVKISKSVCRKIEEIYARDVQIYNYIVSMGCWIESAGVKFTTS